LIESLHAAILALIGVVVGLVETVRRRLAAIETLLRDREDRERRDRDDDR
jgi:hypothetical protein